LRGNGSSITAGATCDDVSPVRPGDSAPPPPTPSSRSGRDPHSGGLRPSLIWVGGDRAGL